MLQNRMIHHQHFGCAILDQHLSLGHDLMAQQNRNHRFSKVGGQLVRLADQFDADFLHHTGALLNNNKNIFTHSATSLR